MWWIVRAGSGVRLTALVGEGSHIPRSVCLAVLKVCWGRTAGCLEMGMCRGIWTGPCCVAASVVRVCVEGRGVAGRGGSGVLVAGAFLLPLLSADS